MKFCFFFVVFALNAAIASTEHTVELKLTQVVYRHGDRSPVSGFPKDNHTITEWLKYGARGYGQLTYIGMQQHYELGQWFRDRYIINMTGFMSGSYNRNELLIRSTDVDRTLMSAYCNLAGFYPAEHAWWPKKANVSFQPIPVHTVPAKLDNLLDMGVSCAEANNLYERLKLTQAFKQKAKDNKQLFKFLTNHTGMEPENLDTFWEVLDTLYCENAHNMTLPDWTNQKWPNSSSTETVLEHLLRLQSWEFDLRFGGVPEQARLRGGPLLKEMLENMDKNMKDAYPYKFYMYSAHDNTVMAFLHALQLSNHLQPPYTATVILELYHVDNSSFAVKVMYKNESTSEPYVMHVPGCKLIAGGLCPHDQFVTLTKKMVPEHWEKECTIPEDKPADDRYIIGIGIGAGLVFILILIGLVWFIKKKKQNNPADYYGITTEPLIAT